ncbi:PucR family transcriptional regulator ligand-binding domain-containing protein [Psychrobacillus sp. FJAT-51614]|uniref:PucR family transcriptional regulator ligand-binding domain-containing protein n=1 Tax=Psychrobacillus mangrovi TaxID=3117745 RepID=A0ABU8F1F0_9BACI
MVTVKQFAEKLKFYNINLIAGMDGMEVELNYLSIQELPLISERIQSRGFIMTTFAAFTSEVEIINHVKWLLTREIAALAIHSVVLDEIPSSIISIGNEYSLPILSIPFEVSYHEILKTYNQLLLEESDTLREQMEKMNLNLLESIAEDKGASYIIATIGKYINSPILYFDKELNIITVWTDRSIKRDEFSLRVKSALENSSNLLKKEKFEKVSALLKNEFLEESELTFCLFPIADKLDKYGFLVIGYRNTQNLLVDSAVKYGKTALLIDAVKRKSLVKFLKNQDIRLLESIIEGKAKNSSKTANFSLMMKEYNQMYLFHFSNKELVNYGFTYIYDELDGQAQDKVIWIYEQEVICLTSSKIKIQNLENILENFTGVICGISEFKENTYEEDILKKFKQVQRSIEVAKFKETRLIFYEELGFEKYMFILKEEEEAKEAAKRLLEPLIEFDLNNRAELVLTLKSYLRNFFSLKKSAEELFVHRNTISYRLEKIHELYKGINFEKQENYLLFTMSLDLIE